MVIMSVLLQPHSPPHSAIKSHSIISSRFPAANFFSTTTIKMEGTSAASEEIKEEKPSKIFVAGSTGKTGKRIVEQLLSKNFRVRAGARDLERAGSSLPQNPNLQIVRADVTEGSEKLAEAIGDADAVVCATGFQPSLDVFAPWKDEIKLGLYHCMSRMIADPEERAKADLQLVPFKYQEGFFALQQALDTISKRTPVEWWMQFGDGTPELQRFAIRVLGLTCSSSACERNWSTYNQVNTKRRNRLSVLRMNSLVYIMYNKKLREKKLKRKSLKAEEDPLLCEDIPSDDEWFEDDNTDDIPSELQIEDLSIDLFEGDGDRTNVTNVASTSQQQKKKQKKRGKRKMNAIEEDEEEWEDLESSDDQGMERAIRYADDSNEDPLSSESAEE